MSDSSESGDITFLLSSDEDEFTFLKDKRNPRQYLKEFHDQVFNYENEDLYSKGIEDNPILWYDIYDDSNLIDCLDPCLLLNNYPRKYPRIGDEYQAKI